MAAPARKEKHLMSEEMIHIEEELSDAAAKAQVVGKRRVEEITIRGGELKDTLGRLAKEATVRKITVKNREGKTIANIPFVLGAAGVLVIGPWTAVLLAGAWLTRLSILIEYEEAPSKVEEAVEEAAGRIEAAVA
jgi:hypothetical protein